MKSIAQSFYDRLLNVGSITFTAIDKHVEQMFEMLNDNGIKYEARRYNTFVVVLLKTPKSVYHKTKNNQSLRKNTQKKKKECSKMKNWTVKEAAEVIREGHDTEAIKEIVKHFPMFSVILAAKNFDAAMAAMPESLTVRKIENGFSTSAADDADTDDETEEGDETENESAGDADLASMTKDQLISLCDKKGIKVQRHQKPKQYYIDALNAGGEDDTEEEEKPAKAAKPAKVKAKAKKEVEPDENDEEEADPVALFKQCKKLGLDVKPRQPAKYYQDAIAASEKDDDQDEDEDWGDEEEEEAPKKSTKKAAKNEVKKPAGKKPAKKAEPEDDDDEDDDAEDDGDWDI